MRLTRRQFRHAGSFVVGAAGYATVLYYSYKLKIAPLFAYSGLRFRPPTAIGHGAAVLLVAVVAACLPQRFRRPSDFSLWVFFVVAAAPAILLPQYMDTLEPTEATRLGFFVAAAVLVMRIVSLAPRIGAWGGVLLSPRLVWSGLLGFALTSYAALAATSGLSFRWISLTRVYGVREDFALEIVAPLGYAVPWLLAVVNPALMARGLFMSNSRWFFIGGALGQYVIFASTGLKSPLLSIPALLLIRGLFQRPNPTGMVVMRWVALGSLLSLLLDQLLGGITWTSLFVRRFMIVPGSLAAAYVAVFQHRPKLWFGSIYGAESPYPEGATYLVGQLFTGDSSTNANSGFLGDGYLQGGYVGILISACVAGLLLWLTNMVARGLPLKVTATILFMPTISLASGSISTVVATHGFGLALLVCALLPRTGWSGAGHRLRTRSASSTTRTEPLALARR